MSGKRSRDKGLNFERKIARELREENIYPDAKRHMENQWQEAQGYDLDNTGPFKMQLKRNKAYCSISKIEEVQCQEGDIPALITKGDKKREVIVLYWSDFKKILKDIGVCYE